MSRLLSRVRSQAMPAGGGPSACRTRRSACGQVSALTIVWLAARLAVPVGCGEAASVEPPAPWFDRLLSFPYANAAPTGPALQLVRQDFEQLERNRSVIQTPLQIGSRRYAFGLGTHSISHLRVVAPEPIERFEAWAGVDANERTAGGNGSVCFSVEAGGRELFRSPVLWGGEEAIHVTLTNPPTGDLQALDLLVADAPGFDLRRARHLLDRYRSVRHLLVGAWYREVEE